MSPLIRIAYLQAVQQLVRGTIGLTSLLQRHITRQLDMLKVQTGWRPKT